MLSKTPLSARRMAIVAITVVASSTVAQGYFLNAPFCCNAPNKTLSEELNDADAAVLAQLVEMPAPADPAKPRAAIAKSKFKVLEVLKGNNVVRAEETIEAFHFGEANKQTTFLIIGSLEPDMDWRIPIPLTERGTIYVSKLLSLPPPGADRLVFFQDYLQDKDSVIAQDAYDEFAKSTYSAFKDLKPRMRRDQLIGWIQDPNVSATHRRLYLTMLGVCGQPEDLAMLEAMLKEDDPRFKSGLDAMIACYLTLKGQDGLPLVKELFLTNPKVEYVDAYAAVMALRFHGEEGGVIAKPSLLVEMRHLLERPELADLVIPDLARWEDWSALDRLVALFKEATEEASHVRVPVITYLDTCAAQGNEAGKKAVAALEELTKLDPAAVKRARSFGAFGVLGGGYGKTTIQSRRTRKPSRTTKPRANAPNQLRQP